MSYKPGHGKNILSTDTSTREEWKTLHKTAKDMLNTIDRRVIKKSSSPLYVCITHAFINTMYLTMLKTLTKSASSFK